MLVPAIQIFYFLYVPAVNFLVVIYIFWQYDTGVLSKFPHSIVYELCYCFIDFHLGNL